MEHSLPPPHPYPWLLYFNGKGENFCTISDPSKTYSRRIPEFEGVNICAMQHGWCVLAQYSTEEYPTGLFLWNTSNFTKIELPPLERIHVRDHILITSPTATDQVCSVFMISDLPSTLIFYWYLGDKQWTKVDYYDQLISAQAIEGEFSLQNLFYINGCLYAESLFEPSLLVEIKKLEPCGLKISNSHILCPRLPSTGLGLISRMLESNNEVFRIQISHAHNKVMGVFVHKLDFPRRVWLKVESIKDRAFFISDYIGLSFICQAINPETEGGRVYITLNRQSFVHIYNIEDKSIMISPCFLNLPEERFHSTWFMLDLRMTGSIKEDIKKTLKEVGDEIHSQKAEDTITYDEFALPLDIVEAIAKHINTGIDYLHFRATNKLFHSSTPPIRWRSSSAISMSRFDHLSMSPLLVCFEKDNVLTFVHPKNGRNYNYNINLALDPQSYCEICYSKDGWLLMTLDNSSSFFFNPFAKEQEKPLANGPEPENLNTRCMAFSHPPSSPECVVVELKLTFEVEANITCPGWNKWDRFPIGDSKFPLYNITPVFHKGAFYYFNENGKLGVLKVEKEGGGEGGEEEEVRLDFDELDKLDAPCTDYYNKFLVECNDNLLSVFEGHFGKWVRIFKFNESTMTWIQVEDLGNHMLFIGSPSFSAAAHVPGMENKIYFPRIYDENIVFYSLETNNYHTFESNDVVNFHCMSEKVNSSWIEPRWH